MTYSHLLTEALLSLDRTLARSLFDGKAYPWQVLPDLRAFLLALGAQLPTTEYRRVAKDVWVAADATVANTASITGPCIIDHEAEVRHCAFIRGSALVGKGAVVGNSTELKNALLFDGVQVPHYNYIGDSVLGYRAHMGAGAITSNVKSDKTLVSIRDSAAYIETGMKKLGAILGDGAEIGCNSVLCPGSIVGRESIVYPLSRVRSVVAARHIYKGAEQVVAMRPQTEEV